MNCWLSIIIFVSYLPIISQCNSGWRHFYITSTVNTSQRRCPTDHCYPLQDVIQNQSYFFDSNTTLELMPGRYDITVRVGQLVIANVSNFTLRGSDVKSNTSTIISCQQNATFGLIFTNIDNVAILDIEFSHCCAELTTNITIDANRIDDYVKSEIDTRTKQWFNAYHGFCNSQNCFPCCTTIACIDNGKVIITRNTILHSKGVGILILRYVSLNISETLLAYNRINCITYVSNRLANTTTTVTSSHIMSGWENRFNIASGLNLIIVSVSLMTSRFDNIKVTNITFTNSNPHASKGNFYTLVYRGVECKNLAGVRITVTNNTISSTRAVSGMIVEYIILEKIPLHLRVNKKYSVWPQCIQPGVFSAPRKAIVTFNILDSLFKGSCLVLRNLLKTTNKHLNITLGSIKINESSCPTALQFEHTEPLYDDDFSLEYLLHIQKKFFSPPNIPQNQIYIQDLTIASSRNNIMLLTTLNEKTLPTKFVGNIAFIENHGSIVVAKTKLILQGSIQIFNNQANDYESVFLIRESSAVSFQGNVSFMNNRGRQGGAISAYHSSIEFQGIIRFVGNIAKTVGGGISLREGSTIYLKSTTNLIFSTNTAKEYGGGIFVEETLLRESRMTLKCFVQTFNINNTVVFDNNKAGLAGMALFGGWIDVCNPGTYAVRPTHFFKFEINYSYMHAYSDISSNAARVCICKNSSPIINITNFEITTVPGKTFTIEVVAVGQRFGVVPAIVKAEFQNQEENENIITELQRSQNVGTYCTKLSYTVRSRNNNETMGLVIDKQQVPKPDPSLEIDILQFQQLEVIIHLNECPLGLIFDSNRNICVCHYSLENQGIHCNTSSQTVIRNAQKWISATYVDGIAVSHHCPYDYCKYYELSLNLSTPDDQCAFSRSGILCGACQPGHSMILGTSNCKKCSDTWLLLLLPFGLAGMALVVCLMMLNLTVSTGTINGLIFYANIVRANNAIFFPSQSANTFLSWFIAWLNLDLGIETCFFDGFTAYSKTWLQFIFPVYIWILVSAIIISSHYSIRAAKICGNNAVQVLATLFFLSYAKLLRVTIAVFQPTRLIILGDSLNRIKVVWNYDGNLDYLSGRHIPLFVITLLFFFTFFVPYTLALFGIQWLQPISHYKPLFWVSRLKPLFDAYTGPYKDKHRYWTGLLLLLRICLFCIFSANTSGDPAINLLVIIIVIVCLFVYLGLLGGVYKYWPLNLLEYVFFLNLVILSSGTLYTSLVEKSVQPVTQFSVGTTLVVTLFIVLYHGIRSFMNRCHMKEKIYALKCTISRKTRNKNMDVQQCDFEEHPTVTYSVVEMDEKLLHH